MHAWNFLGGWNPATLPIYLTFHRVENVDLLVELLQSIRDAQNGDGDEKEDVPNAKYDD